MQKQLEAMGLSQAQIDEIITYQKQTLLNFVPRSRFNHMNSRRKVAEERLEGVSNYDVIKARAEGLSYELKTVNRQYHRLIKEHLVLKTLLKKQNVFVDAWLAQLNLEGIRVEDGDLIGLDAQLTPLATEIEASCPLGETYGD
ncbi:phage scaffolding protein [Fusibacter sp. JL298sf-3]